MYNMTQVHRDTGTLHPNSSEEKLNHLARDARVAEEHAIRNSLLSSLLLI